MRVASLDSSLGQLAARASKSRVGDSHPRHRPQRHRPQASVSAHMAFRREFGEQASVRGSTGSRQNRSSDGGDGQSKPRLDGRLEYLPGNFLTAEISDLGVRAILDMATKGDPDSVAYWAWRKTFRPPCVRAGVGSIA